MLPGIDGPKETGQFALGVFAGAANCRGSGSALAGDRVPAKGIPEPE